MHRATASSSTSASASGRPVANNNPNAAHNLTLSNVNSPCYRPKRLVLDNNSVFFKPSTRQFSTFSRNSFTSIARNTLLTNPRLSHSVLPHNQNPSSSLTPFKITKRSFFAETESTPNPNSLKFLPQDKTLIDSGTIYFESGNDAYNCPLAKALFRIDGVQSVMLGTNFITVTKYEDAKWMYLKPMIFQSLANFFNSGEVILRDVARPEDTAIDEEDDEVLSAIKEVLETRVRPVVQEDGGDILFKSFENGVVFLKLQGACSTCPSSTVTLKNGIENMLMHYIPEVQGVEDVKDELDEESERQFSKTMEQIGNQ
eukprot:gb/GECH01013106.1/.p1 GENE.gb/GECH01013106.1/~~gb/GECH01013106.1/.p1  ORF type:complete len:314 (+),score=49.70 gb/GECH01013106.1/:1-942(+)